MPCVRPSSPRDWFASFDIHCSSNPGFDMDSTEMFGSVCSQDVRCASAYGVGQSDQPRPTWANVTPAAMSVAAKKETIRCARICMLDYLTPKAYSIPSHVPMYTRPLATVMPLK